MQSLFFFIVALALLIVIHEYGHFWVARRCGVKVLRFSVGFGKPLWSKIGKDGTEYVIAPIPLGGYVKMLDEREAPVTESERTQSFNRQSLSKRIAIVSAGPIANLLFAVVAYWFLFVSGIPGLVPVIDTVEAKSPAAEAGLIAGDEFIRVNDDATPTWSSVHRRLAMIAETGGKATISVISAGSEKQLTLSLPELGLEQSRAVLDEIGIAPARPALSPVIGQVVADEPADKAGIESGDRLISANGVMLDDWSAWVKIIQQNANQTMEVAFERAGHTHLVNITPMADEEGKGRIGAGVDPQYSELPQSMQAELRYGPIQAMQEAVSQTWLFSVTTLKSFAGMLTGSISTENLGGPVSIAQLAGSSAEQGMISFVSFLAMISITLGILNLLPVPMLDGGHLALFLIEAVRGKPVSEKNQIRAQRIGFILLLMLMFLAFFNDLIRLFG